MIRQTTAITALLLLLTACSGDPNARTGIFFSQSQAQERIDSINKLTLAEELALLDKQKETADLKKKLNSLKAERRRIQAAIARESAPDERERLLEQKAKLEAEIQALSDLGN